MSQFSVARYYGGCVLNGVHYKYDPENDELIRDDVVKAEQATRKRLEKVERDKWMAIRKKLDDSQGEFSLEIG